VLGPTNYSDLTVVGYEEAGGASELRAFAVADELNRLQIVIKIPAFSDSLSGVQYPNPFHWRALAVEVLACVNYGFFVGKHREWVNG
jgi:hypothetical protein